MQLQNIIKLVKVANTQIAEIEFTILQASNNYQIQIAGDIFSISEDLQDIDKENDYVKRYMKEIQNTYK